MSRGPGRLLTVLAGVLAPLVVAGPASAHVRGEAAGSDFDGRVESVTPRLPGVTVRILQFGGPLRAHAAARARRRACRPRVGPGVSRAGVRLARPPHHWMSEGVLPPRVAADPTRVHVVSEWVLPLRHGTTEAEVSGVLTWSPPPSPALVRAVGGGLVLTAGAAALLARTPLALGGLLAVGAAAALWHAGATPEPSATTGSHAGAVIPALLPALLCAVLGLRAAVRGRGVLTGLLAGGTGWLLLVQGLPDVDVLWSADLASAGPPALARAAVTVLVPLGVGLVLGGIAAARRFQEPVAAAAGTGGGRALPVP